MSSDLEQETEQELNELGKVAPRLTPSHIDSRIREKTFTLMPNGRTLICELTLINGFTVRGESSCVSAENFVREIGEKWSFENARNKIWELEGYLLTERIYRGEIG